MRPGIRGGWPPRFIIALGGATILVAALIIGVHLAGRARTWQLFGQLIAAVPTRDSVVALTIDDGPSARVAQLVLDTLRVHNAHATFFVVGTDLAHAMPVGAALVQAGHELADHSWSHRRMVGMSPDTIASEITRTDSLIRLAGQRDPILFRPPYGYKFAALPWYLRQTNRTTIMWSIEPDSYDLDAGDIVEDVLDRVHPGAVILLHVWYAGREETRKALGPMIDSLHARGYSVVTMSELLRHAGRV